MIINESTVMDLIAEIENRVMSEPHADRTYEAGRAVEMLHGITRLILRGCEGADAKRSVAELIAAQERISAVIISHHVTPAVSRHGARAGVLR